MSQTSLKSLLVMLFAVCASSALAQMPKTQERVMHTLKTGKPLRN